jgi:hypothetical protein
LLSFPTSLEPAFFHYCKRIPVPRLGVCEFRGTTSAVKYKDSSIHNLSSKSNIVRSVAAMTEPRNYAVVEEDVESSMGRDSEEMGEMDRFLDQKQPSESVNEISRFQTDECPLCLRKARWRSLLTILRLKDKQRAVQCHHDRIIIQEYLRRSRISPVARTRRGRCRLLASFILVAFALLYVVFISLQPSNTC